MGSNKPAPSTRSRGALALITVLIALAGRGARAEKPPVGPGLAAVAAKADTIVIRRWKGASPAAEIVSGARHVSRIFGPQTWRRMVQGSCGYQWTIHFLARGRPISTALVRAGGCAGPRIHFMRETRKGELESATYLLDRRLARALRPHLRELTGKRKGRATVYRYLVEASVAPDSAVERLARRGLMVLRARREPPGAGGRRPTTYPVQVVHKTPLTARQRVTRANAIPFVKRITPLR